MIAADTNVLIRLLTGDDPAQAARARALFEAETIWLAKTVVLEAEWVLRRLYGFTRGQVGDALVALIALPNVRCEDEATVADALHWTIDGLDFADALHLASARHVGRFATFDRDLARQASAAAVDLDVTSL